MAAHKSKLGALHELVADAYTKGIELDMESEIFNPALLGSAAKFLKDNDITAEVKSADDLANLRDKLQQAAAERRAAGNRILQAVGSAEDY